ncbi:hypothetical protein [Pseudoduganella buxea]|uniref:Uncharacterized protein n=1 Tax=Pseudoduganella buxea TaxID=1949069 RepID=A0A6I3T778_9BURK|nr:hypothetical protein [Pseudoduganella buxea]MTV56232.1 hypothetical protein [Pseudoduganella buxea]GGC04205.1 hypothetical protein GCM10011572_27670 [Pseudoduganella buxea]
MASPNNFNDTAGHLVKLLRALHDLEANPFLAQLGAVETLHAWYDVVCRLDYAANSKYLRDTGEERVHLLCEEIRVLICVVDEAFRFRMLPASPSQKQSWDSAVSRDPSARYAFRDDGSLEISLLDARLDGTTLHVKRLWNHVCNTEGDWVDFHIKLDETQVNTIRRKLATLRAIRATMKP